MTYPEREALALFGGPKTIGSIFEKYNSLGKEEVLAAKEVIESGVLSQFLGCWDPDFYGGPQVQKFEKKWQDFFNVKHAISVNSATSGLIAALGAIGIEPGDEVIVSPWTMCATATSILHWNAIPVFADIEEETFCLDPRSVEANITKYTKAILAVDIFGQSADMDALTLIAAKYGLKIISDSAQAPGARVRDKYAGTLADIGCFSLNYHKHIHTGEGGVLVTDNDEYAERMRLIRNHAEGVVEAKGTANISNMIGYNFRLGEIESAIGIQQLTKLPSLLASRQAAATKLTNALSELPGLQTPVVKKDYTHSYYLYGMKVDTDLLGASRDRICEALMAEGLTGLCSRYANLHLLPMYQQKIAYGSRGFPWSSDICRRQVNYDKGICPVAEKLQNQTYLGYEMCLNKLSEDDITLIIGAFEKVWGNKHLL